MSLFIRLLGFILHAANDCVGKVSELNCRLLSLVKFILLLMKSAGLYLKRRSLKVIWEKTFKGSD